MSGMLRWFWKSVYPRLTLGVARFLPILPSDSKWGQWYYERVIAPTDKRSLTQKKNHILFFCPSLGEYESIKSIIHAFRSKKNVFFIEVSFFSPSGYTVVREKNNWLVDFVSYTPIDTKTDVAQFFKNRKVDFVIFSGIHLWPVFNEHLISRSIPYSFVGARMKSGYVKRVYYKSMLHYLEGASSIYTINSSSQERLIEIDQHLKGLTTGDPRASSIKMDLESPPAEMKRIKDFLKNDVLIIFGSTHERDEDIILPVLARLVKKWKVIIAPHDISRAAKLTLKCKESCLFTEAADSKCNILILNTVGHLKYAYPYAKIAYVGGGFSNALHSILEPLVAGCLVITGHLISKDSFATDLHHQGKISIVRNSESLIAEIEKLAHQEGNIDLNLNVHLQESMSGIETVVKDVIDILKLEKGPY